MNTFYTEEELAGLGLKAYGKNVLIGRNAILYNPEKLTLGHDVRIDDFTIISGRVTLHNYIHISHFCGLYGGEEGIELMDFSGVSSKVNLYAVSDDYGGDSMTNPMVPAEYKKTMIFGKVLLEKHSIIGTNSVVLPGVTVSEGCSIGSMSLCAKSTEPWGVYVGIPAKRMKERKREILNMEKKFKESGAYCAEFEVGQKAFMEKNISEEDVRHFAGISGDDNPLHLDETYAAGSRFGKRVVHGMLVASLISGVIGTKLPGKGTIYLSQSLKFLKPVFIGDTIRAEVEITKLDTERGRIALETRVIRSDGACALAGEALVIPPENLYCGAKPVFADIDRGGVNLIFHRKAKGAYDGYSGGSHHKPAWQALEISEKEIVARYNEVFSKMPELFVQREIPESDTTRPLYILRICPERLTVDRKQFFDAMAAENICCNVHYIPVYYYPYYEKLGY